MRFLDRFVFRNPKKDPFKNKPQNVFSKRNTYQAPSGVKRLAPDSKEYIDRDESQVQAHILLVDFFRIICLCTSFLVEFVCVYSRSVSLKYDGGLGLSLGQKLNVLNQNSYVSVIQTHPNERYWPILNESESHICACLIQWSIFLKKRKTKLFNTT